MNLIPPTFMTIRLAKPRSRGDEPSAVKQAITNIYKTPLTRG